MLKSRDEAEQYFVDLLRKGFLEYRNGEIWRHYNFRQNKWIKPKRCDTLCNPRGYLRLATRINNKNIQARAHRVIWRYFNGDVPEGLQVNHIDGNKQNNKIENLELVTPSENLLFDYKFGRRTPKPPYINTGVLRGEFHPRSKLTEKHVNNIRSLYATGKYSYQKLSQMFKVKPSCIQKVIERKTWKHVV